MTREPSELNLRHVGDLVACDVDACRVFRRSIRLPNKCAKICGSAPLVTRIRACVFSQRMLNRFRAKS